jgi:hypothetical protein
MIMYLLIYPQDTEFPVHDCAPGTMRVSSYLLLVLLVHALLMGYIAGHSRPRHLGWQHAKVSYQSHVILLRILLCVNNN